MRLRPRVEVFCFRENRVLAGWDAEGSFVIFPGGGIDPGESAIEAAKRETAEEAGRRLINCTVAHPATVQAWPAGHDPNNASGYVGSLTTWVTGSCSDEFQEDLSHPDYYPSITWRRIEDVVKELHKTLGNGWDDDNRVRLSILEAQQKLRRPVKFAEVLASA